MAKSPNSAVKQILFDTLVEMGRLDSNPTDQTIQTINDISDSEALQLLRSVGVGPTISKAGGGMMNIDEMIRPIGMAGGGTPMDELISRRARIVGQLNAERGVPGVLGGGMNEEKVRVLQIELDQIDRMISMLRGEE